MEYSSGFQTHRLAHEKFEILTTVMFQVEFFWIMTLCIFVVEYQRFRGLCCLHFQHIG